MNYRVFILIFLGIIINQSKLLAQPLNLGSYNWIFGNADQYIRFNRVTAQPELVYGKFKPFGMGGSVTASDPISGTLLFYSDGKTIFDATHQPMPNGTGLSGNPGSNQPVAVCPVPEKKGQYILFTNDATATSPGTVRYMVVDLAVFGNSTSPLPAFGDVSVSEAPVPGIPSAVSEGMIIIPHSNGKDFWLINHLYTTQSYLITRIIANSGTLAFSTQTSPALGLPTTVSHFAYNKESGKIAVAPSVLDVDAIVLNFNASTGSLTFDQYIYNSAVRSASNPSSTNQAIYDIEWSPDGNFIYYSVFGDDANGISGNVYQFNLLQTKISLTPVINKNLFRSFGLQRAPDSTIYHLYQELNSGPILLGRINKPDTIASEVNYQQAVLLLNNWDGRQFPAFPPLADPRLSEPELSVTFTYQGECLNNPTSFFPTVIPAADSLAWNFGDGTGSNDWAPIHTFKTPPGEVTVTAFLNGYSETYSLPLSLKQFDLKINLTQDTTACRSEFPPPRGSASPQQFRVQAKVQGGTPISYDWSNGDTGAFLTPDSAGYYYVVATDATGCAAYAGVNVKEYKLQDQRSNVWYFGNKAGIDFNIQPPKALDDGAMNAPEGCAVIGDRNGRVIFYTDGDRVYNRVHQEIASGLGGNLSSTQSSVIIQVPGDETLYYIFTTEAAIFGTTYTLYYSLFDLKLNGGLGAVVQKKVPLFARSTERITASASWLIAHEFGNNSFRAYQVTSNGIGEPVITSIGSDHKTDNVTQAEGYMKLGPGNNLAVALNTAGVSNVIEVFHFTDSTGVIKDLRRVDLNQAAGQVYGIEFSPGGNKLYATVKGAPSAVYEYFIDSIQAIYYKNKVTTPGELGAIQIAPDGQIYIAVNGSTTLGIVQVAEDTTKTSTYNFAAFALASGTNSRLGLPNFIQQSGNNFGGPALLYAGICLGTPTNFIGIPTDPIDTYTWAFGDGSGSTKDSVQHLYAAAATYRVTLNLKNRCGLDTTLFEQVRVVPTPNRPSIPPAIALCTTELNLDANVADVPNLEYLWSTGATTKNIIVDTPGSYGVTLTDKPSGCLSTAISLVVDNRPFLDLGPDKTLCQNEFANALNVKNPEAEVSWIYQGVLTGSTAQSFAVDTSLPGTFEWIANLKDPITGCRKSDTVTYKIKQSPEFTLNAPATFSSCGAKDGVLEISITAPNNSFSYFVTSPSFEQSAINKPTGTYPLNNLFAGTYSVLVSDEISGCSIAQTIGLSDAQFNLSVADVVTCSQDPLTLVTDAVLPFEITVTDSRPNPTPVTETISALSASYLTTNKFSPETYTVEIKTSNGCIKTVDNVKVTKGSSFPITTEVNNCVVPASISVTAPAGLTYLWSGPGIINSPDAATTTVLPGAPGSYDYQVMVKQNGFCDAVETVTVYVEHVQTSIISTDPCQDQVRLIAPPVSGQFTYRWYRNGILDLDYLGSQVALKSVDNNIVFRVEVVSGNTGCIYASEDFTAQILGQVDATITATPACQDGKLFTLTASTSDDSNADYSWFFNNSPISGVNDTIMRKAEGVYKVRVSKSSCFAESEIDVVRAPLPEGKLPGEFVICNDPENTDPSSSSVELDPGFFLSYSWFRNGISLSNNDQTLVADSEAVYQVELTNSFSCTSIDETRVLNDCIPRIIAPNAFRPESSIPDNHYFFVFSLFITDNFRVYLYNRWGELVFQSSDRDFRWNGGYNNDPAQPLPGGTYAWVVQYINKFQPNAGWQEKRGGVLLLR